MSGFSFSFSGDDIEDHAAGADIGSTTTTTTTTTSNTQAAETGTLQRRTSTAFPITGQAQLPAQTHSLPALLATLPSKIAYSTLSVLLDAGAGAKGKGRDETVQIPRRELWDVRVQLMAEEDDEGLSHLGKDDVKTGVYEGGFKSWESSVDLVRVLAEKRSEREADGSGRWVLELGCGTALPTLAVLQWHIQDHHHDQNQTLEALHLGFADYNPDVLRLVTLPNILLSWAQTAPNTGSEEAWEAEGELELTPVLIANFLASLEATNLTLSFYSGAWSPSFVSLLSSSSFSTSPGEQNNSTKGPANLTILAAETIYSPAALQAFTETMMTILQANPTGKALVGAKMVYFGVGGSVEDFCALVRSLGGREEKIREEADGVRRAVVEVTV
ncbi:hypothetical protein PVAG01_10569 [Phlyctema vagabunda]|uniref:protein-histidine N-methyltransferase n=1 Tax=Phlyctema vagabunda TaxID=108571 RepID=A0ABR4P2M7_9HELO